MRSTEEARAEQAAQVHEIAALMANPQQRTMFYLDGKPPVEAPGLIDARLRAPEPPEGGAA